MKKKSKDYEIQFAGLKEGKHTFEYRLDNAFFDKEFDYKEFNQAKVTVDLLLVKKANMLELFFTVHGTVNVNCDVSNEAYDQPLTGALEIVVKFGSTYEEDDDEIIVLPYGAHEINVKQYLYEVVVLAVPYKKVHPKVLDGTMDSAILDKLEELSPGHKTDINTDNTDPRWDKLKELLNEK